MIEKHAKTFNGNSSYQLNCIHQRLKNNLNILTVEGSGVFRLNRQVSLESSRSALVKSRKGLCTETETEKG